MNATSTIRNPSLCDWCQQKAKFPNYDFCGKNCAAQWQQQCDYCHQKPKHKAHDYCGKNCAALAAQNTAGAMPPAPARSNTKPASKKSKSLWTNLTGSSGSNASSAQTAPAPPAGLQQLPPMQFVLPPQAIAAIATTPGMPSVLSAALNTISAYAQGPQPAQSMNTGASAPPPAAFATPVLAGQPLANVTNVVPGPTKLCRIPGCSQPAHVDQTGVQAGDWCSMKHREEAVRAGLAYACIMCLRLPQSGTDHFCGKACRDVALSMPM